MCVCKRHRLDALKNHQSASYVNNFVAQKTQNLLYWLNFPHWPRTIKFDKKRGHRAERERES